MFRRIIALVLLTAPDNLKTTNLIQADFCENYAHVCQDEIQSAHWHNQSTPIYMTMVYFQENENIMSEHHIVVSDYFNHDK